MSLASRVAPELRACVMTQCHTCPATLPFTESWRTSNSPLQVVVFNLYTGTSRTSSVRGLSAYHLHPTLWVRVAWFREVKQLAQGYTSPTGGTSRLTPVLKTSRPVVFPFYPCHPHAHSFKRGGTGLPSWLNGKISTYQFRRHGFNP